MPASSVSKASRKGKGSPTQQSSPDWIKMKNAARELVRGTQKRVGVEGQPSRGNVHRQICLGQAFGEKRRCRIRAGTSRNENTARLVQFSKAK
jgi:hypothetical protein